MISDIRNIIISRTDSIGDVMLTLPLAKVLKDRFPGVKIAFLGKDYTRPVIDTCIYIDEFILLEDFLKGNATIDGQLPDAIVHVFPVAAVAKKAKELGMRYRIGTSNRLYHWHTCNKLVRLSRKNSDLHEAQLNLKLLAPFGIETKRSTNELAAGFGFTRIQPLKPELLRLLEPGKYHLILHPKSQGSAREWGLNNFVNLINKLNPDQYQIFISGTAKERPLLDELFMRVGNKVTDITGRLDLYQFISFISRCDGLIANSTGPLHIAAALGIQAVGIYPPIRPMHPGRWAPIGNKATHIVAKKDCSDCRKSPRNCQCISGIDPAAVVAELR